MPNINNKRQSLKTVFLFNRPVNLPAGMLGRRKNKVLLLEPTERTNI